jgi:hypothetical protein
VFLYYHFAAEFYQELLHFIVNFREMESYKIHLVFPCIPHQIGNSGLGIIAPQTSPEIKRIH